MQLRAPSAWAMVVVSLFCLHTSRANEFEYPELMVAPRASERLRMEAQAENEGKWLRFWPIQFSSLFTMSLGFSTLSSARYDNSAPLIPLTEPNSTVNDRRTTATMAIGVGATWMVTSLIMSAIYTPYQSGWETVKAMPNQSKRDQLTRERVAEEVFADANAMAWRLTVLSVLTQFGTSLYTFRLSGLDGTTTPILALSSAVVSLVPILFRFKWMGVYAQHQDYKKKIYGPVANLQPGALDFERGEIAPGLTLSLRF